MAKLRFLLLDACVVIKLFELKLWEQLIERCEIVLAETVVAESQYFEDDEVKEAIDLSPYAIADKITIVSTIFACTIKGYCCSGINHCHGYSIFCIS